jgi:hypothetical protein
MPVAARKRPDLLRQIAGALGVPDAHTVESDQGLTLAADGLGLWLERREATLRVEIPIGYGFDSGVRMNRNILGRMNRRSTVGRWVRDPLTGILAVVADLPVELSLSPLAELIAAMVSGTQDLLPIEAPCTRIYPWIGEGDVAGSDIPRLAAERRAMGATSDYVHKVLAELRCEPGTGGQATADGVSYAGPQGSELRVTPEQRTDIGWGLLLKLVPAEGRERDLLHLPPGSALYRYDYRYDAMADVNVARRGPGAWVMEPHNRFFASARLLRSVRSFTRASAMIRRLARMMLAEAGSEPTGSPSIGIRFPMHPESMLRCDRDRVGHAPRGPQFGLGWDRWNRTRRGLPGPKSDEITELVVTEEGRVSFVVRGEGEQTVTGWNHTPQRLREHYRGAAKARWHDRFRLLVIGDARFHIAANGPSPCNARWTG